jgi:hypothetical protein
MIEQVILGVQIVTALGYIIALFGLYRLLVSQKNATIELLKEKNGFLQEQLDSAEAESPTVVAESLARRVKIQEDELGRLMQDQDQDKELIEEKKRELAQARAEIERFREKLDEASYVLSEFSCPYCGAVMTMMDYFPDTAIFRGREIDFEHKVIEYACGLAIYDGKEVSPCPNKDSSGSTS